MSSIKNVVFDLGGVIITLNRECAVKRFEEIGLKSANELIDPYEQRGFFLDVENGKIGVEEFCQQLTEHAGKEISKEQALYGWLGFVVEVPQYKLDYILELRKKYKVYLLSNTNPFIQEWARSSAFSSAGRPIGDYFDKMYASYEVGITKPDPAIYEYMLNDLGMIPRETLFVDDGRLNIEAAHAFGIQTYQPENNEDWRHAIDRLL